MTNGLANSVPPRPLVIGKESRGKAGILSQISLAATGALEPVERQIRLFFNYFLNLIGVTLFIQQTETRRCFE